MLLHYEMRETLGRGGFSKVLLGLDHSTSPPLRVALKLLRLSSLSLASSAAIESVQREIHALRVIEHAHVLDIRDVHWSVSYPKKDGTSYPVVLIVLELALGGELFDLIFHTGAFSEVLARTYFHQLIDAIGYCHAQGICHRDLKPENLLLDARNALKVADFGLSHRTVDERGAHQLLHTTCGTLSYCAPEVRHHSAAQPAPCTTAPQSPLRGTGLILSPLHALLCQVLEGRRRGYDGASADVWSCGVILFVMVAAFPPFQHPTLDDWWYNKLATNRPQLFWDAHLRSVSFSPSLQRFITRLLDVTPARRMTVDAMLRDEWFSGETLSADLLYAEMQRRRDDLSLRRMQQRAEGERQRRVEEELARREAVVDDRSVESLDEDSDEDLHRGFGDALPTSQPTMALGTLDGAAGGEEARARDFLNAVDELAEAQPQPPSQPQPQPSVRSKMSMTLLRRSSKAATSHPPAASAAVAGLMRPSQPLPPPTRPAVAVYDSAQTVPSLTLLPSPLPLSTLHQRLMSLLSFHRFHVKHREAQHRYKAWRQTPTGEVSLTVRVWRRREEDEDKDGYLLEFRRHTGDSGQYRAMFSGLLVEMTERGIVASATPP